jgi:hypothetical protein
LLGWQKVNHSHSLKKINPQDKTLAADEITIGIDGENGFGRAGRKQIQSQEFHYFHPHLKF